MALLPGGRSATRDDVARRAGVSVATVSYVLNDGPRGVSDDKRRRVLAAIADLGYRPNAIARSLRVRHTRILGLVLPNSANPYFAALSHAIEEAAAARGYQVVVSNASDNLQREAAQIEALLRLQVDGLLWIPADLQLSPAGPETAQMETDGAAFARSAAALSAPAVLVDRALAGQSDRPPLDVVGPDNAGGGRLAAEHLLALGHRRIAFLSGPVGHRHADERLAGAAAALASSGLALPDELVAHGSFDYASGAACAGQWLALPAKRQPTAIICCNDAMAIGVLHAAAAAGWHVPEQLSVVGYDDVPQAAFCVPGLTTIAQPLDQMGTTAVERLLARVEAPAVAPPPVHTLLPVRLVVRHSTGPPPGQRPER